MSLLLIRTEDVSGDGQETHVKVILTDTDSNPVIGRRSNGTVVHDVDDDTGPDGLLDLELTPNSEILPANTRYTIYLNEKRVRILKGAGDESIPQAWDITDTELGTSATLPSLADVDVAGIVDGDTLLWDEDEGLWKPGLPTTNGVTDHGDLTGLDQDDHPQYHNDTRGDLRYDPLGIATTLANLLDARIDTLESDHVSEAEMATKVAKAGDTMTGNLALPNTGKVNPTGFPSAGLLLDGADTVRIRVDPASYLAITRDTGGDPRIELVAEGALSFVQSLLIAHSGFSVVGHDASNVTYDLTLTPAGLSINGVTLAAIIGATATGGDLTGTVSNAQIAANTAGNTELADMLQATMKGRAAGAGTGDPQDLTPTQIRTLIDLAAQISGSALGGVLGGTVGAATFSADMATQSELDAEAATRLAADNALDGRTDALEAFTVAADPLPQYQRETEKGANNGYASLDGSGLIPTSQLPALAITDTFVAASQAAMLALTAQRGDAAIRTDLTPQGTFLLTADDPTILANWHPIEASGLVTSVNGNTGAVSGLLAATNNLTDVGNTATAFANIKQAATTSATGVVELATDGETAAGVVVQGNDSRLSNARTPTAHAASHLAGGGDTIASGTETVPGLLELATTAEASTGTDTARAVTPAGLKAAAIIKAPTALMQSIVVPTSAHQVMLGAVDILGSNFAMIGVGDDNDTVPKVGMLDTGVWFGPGNAPSDTGITRTAADVLNLNGARLEGAADPNSADDLTTLGFADGRYVRKSLGGLEVIQTHGNTGATETIDVANGNVHIVTQDQACTYTFTAPSTSTEAVKFELIMTAITGASTWPASVNWPGGLVPAPTGRARYVFASENGGTDWDGVLVGSAFA